MGQFAEYAAHGWKLCSIDKGHKAPLYPRWQLNPIPDDAADGLDGAGLLHAYSGTCCLDLDNLDTARTWLAERGVDVDSLLAASNAVRIDSGRPNRAKLLYRLSKPLRTIKLDEHGLELRCATSNGSSVQDVLPPTVHPDTKKPYVWRYGEELTGHWSRLPPIPPSLLALWRQLAPPVEAAPAAPRAEPTASTERLWRVLDGRSPDLYKDWIKAGMALHDGSGGAEEALLIWNEWSESAPEYKGIDDCRTHWLSFSSTPGKHVVTLESLEAEQPARADEFPEITPEEIAATEADSTLETIRETVEMRRKEAVEWLEKRLIYVSSSGAYFDTEKHRLILTDRAIEHEFSGFMPKNKAGRLSPVKVLRESRTKRMIEGIGFHPGEGPIFRSADTGDEYANLYRNRLPDPLEPTTAELERIDWLFARIDDADYADWLRQFFAYAVQHPGVKIKSAPLIWSETEGNGKTTLLRVVPALLVGRSYSREVTTALLNSDFNDYLLNSWHVNLTEFRADSRGERRVISAKLKAWITDDEIALHPKGSAAYNMPNHFFVTATSNENDAASIGNQDRRWGVHELHAKQFTPTEQAYIYDQFLSTKRAAAVLRHYFLNLGTGSFRPSDKAPETAARQDMVRASQASDLTYLLRVFEERSGPFERDVVRTSEIAEAVQRATRFTPSADRIGRLLRQPPFNGISKKARVGKGSVNFMIVANHAKWAGESGPILAAEAAGENFEEEIDILS